MGIWDKIRSIFIKKEKDELELKAKQDTLVYSGNEIRCWACDMPIHETHKSRKLQGRRLHIYCFKKIKKIALKGGGVDDFLK